MINGLSWPATERLTYQVHATLTENTLSVIQFNPVRF